MTMLNLAQLLRVPHVDNDLRYDITPDGRRLVFSWNKTGKWELWERTVRGSDMPRLVSKIHGAKFSPRYSPDSSMIAFALDLDGSEAYHIAIHDLKQDRTVDLTPNIAYAHQPNITWSPDGNTLAVLSDAKGQFAFYVLPIDGSPAHLVKNIFHPCWDAVWSPDGQWIAVESESSGSDRSIHLVPVGHSTKGRKRKTVQLQVDDKVLNAQHAVWSPDSRFLAFSGELDEWHDIGIFNIDTQAITWINRSDGDDTQPAISQDGRTVGWVHAEGAFTSFQFKEHSGAVQQIKVGAGVHSHPKFAGDSVVILYEAPNRPCDLWKINLANRALEQLTHSLPDELKESDFIQPEEVWYIGKDGAQIPALLYRAKPSKSAVVNIHGGPNWQFQFVWNPIMSHMASRGWTVLAPNYRGSTGYGKKWQSASRFDMGGVDNDDCAAGAKYLVENGFAEKEKIGITGRSHGGYLTMTCMTTHPELWAVGSAVVPFLNWQTSHKRSREDLRHWNIENMGDPDDNEELWIARSPYFFLDRITAPLQMICGRNDPRCPASESIEARDKLLELGRKVELLVYENEGHEFLDTETLIEAENGRIEFLARVLEKQG